MFFIIHEFHRDASLEQNFRAAENNNIADNVYRSVIMT